MIHGWIILDKPHGLGSTQAVSAVKRVLRATGYKTSGKGPGKVKVGHGGTLDPLATGVLPIAIGEATKLTGRMLDASKEYEFTISFGSETAGLDAEGEVVDESDRRPTLAEVEAVLPRFTGKIEQIPPAFSAIKVDGKRAYDRARAGETPEMSAREVEVYSLTTSPLQGRGRSREAAEGEGAASSSATHADAPPSAATSEQTRKSRCLPPEGERLDSLTLSAHVSKGTYIRSLARDIARALGTVGHVSMLRRTKAGPFALKDAISLDKLEKLGKGAPQQDIILPLEAGLVDIPVLDLSPEMAGVLKQGRVLTGIATQDGLHFARGAELRPVALVEATAGMVKVIRGFNLDN